MASRQKVVVLGVDGADFSYYRTWIARGMLPCFAGLAARGRIGILQSTYPPVTAPAWISMITGQSPGEHGVVGFGAPNPGNGEYTRRVVNSSFIEAPFLWEVAGDRGADCLVVNVPLTYPVRPLRGTLVSGMLTPEGANFTYPAEYEPELRLLQPDYEIDIYWQEYKFRGHDLVKDQKAVTRARAELCLKMLESKPWDFFMVVFTGADRLQHCLHEHVARIHDDDAVRNDTLTAAVREYFVTLDAHLGEIVKAAGPDANVIVVSDHGFGPLERSVYFNKWLADQGLLYLRPLGTGGSLKVFKRAMNAVGIRRETLTEWGQSLGMKKVVDQQVQKLNPFVGGIDWARTRVFYFPMNGFVINLEGREMFGCVPQSEYESVREDLMDRLRALTGIDGEPLIPVVRKREDVFRGRYLERLPDVFIEFLDRPYEAFMQDFDVPNWLMQNDWGNGTHRRNGLYLGAGPGLARGDEVDGLQIFDVAPNILHLLGCPIPSHMDGRFRPDLFAPGLSEPRFDSSGPHGEAPRFGISKDEERDLEEKLKGLGYL